MFYSYFCVLPSALTELPLSNKIRKNQNQGEKIIASFIPDSIFAHSRGLKDCPLLDGIELFSVIVRN